MGSKNQKTIGDYVTLQRGNTYKSRLLNLPGPYLLGLGSIERNGGFRAEKLKTYGGPSQEKLLVRPGDLFVSLKDITQAGDLLGSIARVPPSIHVGRMTQDTVKLVFNTDESIDNSFFYWSLRTPIYKNYCRARALGTTNLSLSRDDFLAFPIPQYTEERQTIVSALDAIEAKIELNRQMNAKLEVMAQALFKSWFVDFDPVIDNALAAGNPIPNELTERAERRAQAAQRQSPEQPHALPAATRQQFPDRFVFSETMGWVPEGVDICSVGEEFTVIMGQSPPGDTYNELRKGLPFFQGRTDFGFRYPSNRIYCTAPKRLARKGDTLVSVRAPVGDVNIAADDCCIGRGVSAVKHVSDSRSFTYYSMQQLKERFAVFESEGTVFGSINQKDFKALPQVRFSKNLIEEFEACVGAFDSKIETNTESIRELTRIRDTLLPKLLSGQLRIPEAEQMLAEAL